LDVRRKVPEDRQRINIAAMPKIGIMKNMHNIVEHMENDMK
jgi:hypothetical protein